MSAPQVSIPVAVESAPLQTLTIERVGKGVKSNLQEGLSDVDKIRVSLPGGNCSFSIGLRQGLDEGLKPDAGLARKLGSFSFSSRSSSSSSLKRGNSIPVSPTTAGPSVTDRIRVGIEEQEKSLRDLDEEVVEVNEFWWTKTNTHSRCIPLIIDAFLDLDGQIPTMDEAIARYPILTVDLGRTEGVYDSIRRANRLAKAMTVTHPGFMALPFTVHNLDRVGGTGSAPAPDSNANSGTPPPDRARFDRLLERDDALTGMIATLLRHVSVPYQTMHQFPDIAEEMLDKIPTIPLDDARRNLCFLWPTFRLVRTAVLQVARLALDINGAGLPVPQPVDQEIDGGLFMKGPSKKFHSRRSTGTSSILSKVSSVLSMSSESTASTAASSIDGSSDWTPATSVAPTPTGSPVMSRSKPRFPPALTPEIPKVRIPSPRLGSCPKLAPAADNRSAVAEMAEAMMLPLEPLPPVKAGRRKDTLPPPLIPRNQSIVMGSTPLSDNKSGWTKRPAAPRVRTCHCRHHHEVEEVTQYQL